MTDEQRKDDILNDLLSRGVHVEIDPDADTVPHSEPPASIPVDLDGIDLEWREPLVFAPDADFSDLTDITNVAKDLVVEDLGEEPPLPSERLRREIERKLLIDSSDEKTMIGLGAPLTPVPTPVPENTPPPIDVLDRRRVSAPPMRTTPTSSSPPPRITPTNRHAQSWIVPPQPVIRDSQISERPLVSSRFLLGLMVLVLVTAYAVMIGWSYVVLDRPFSFRLPFSFKLPF